MSRTTRTSITTRKSRTSMTTRCLGQSREIYGQLGTTMSLEGTHLPNFLRVYSVANLINRTLVNYDSGVIITSKLLIATTLEL